VVTYRKIKHNIIYILEEAEATNQNHRYKRKRKEKKHTHTHIPLYHINCYFLLSGRVWKKGAAINSLSIPQS